MLIVIFGESCTGKSTLAGSIAEKIHARVFSGRDYMRLSKNESDALSAFKNLLTDAVRGTENIIYVISETEHLNIVPEGGTRVLVTADLDTIKERFKARMHGTLPPPVEQMLERKHGAFDLLPHDIHVHGENVDAEDIMSRLGL